MSSVPLLRACEVRATLGCPRLRVRTCAKAEASIRMTSESKGERLTSGTWAETGARIVLQLAIVAAAFATLLAIFVTCTAYWTNRESAPFELRVGVSGEWKETWSFSGPMQRVRRVRLLPHIEDDTLPRGTGVQVRVTPVDALVPRSRMLVDGDGWATIGSQANHTPEPELDPTLVERIEYRVVAVPPAWEGTQVRLFVAGRADSSLSGPSWGYWYVAFVILALGSVPLVLLRSSARAGETDSAVRDAE